MFPSSRVLPRPSFILYCRKRSQGFFLTVKKKIHLHVTCNLQAHSSGQCIWDCHSHRPHHHRVCPMDKGDFTQPVGSDPTRLFTLLAAECVAQSSPCVKPVSQMA